MRVPCHMYFSMRAPPPNEVFLALIVTLAAFPLLAEFPIPMIWLVLILGLLSTATIAPRQSLVLRHAGAAPTLSLAVNVGSFNLANAIG